MPLSEASPGDIVIASHASQAEKYAGIAVERGRIVSNGCQGVRDDSSLAGIKHSHFGTTAFRYVGRLVLTAWAECGNYVFIDEGKGGAVFFWNHEEPEEITKLTANSRKFLDILEPHGVKDVRLKRGQVESVWVHQDLLKRIQK